MSSLQNPGEIQSSASGARRETYPTGMLLLHLHSSESIDRIQLLLTRSPYLAAKLQAYAKSLIDTQARAVQLPRPAESSDQGLNSDSFFTLNDGNFPFVCTYDEFLGLLENTFRYCGLSPVITSLFLTYYRRADRQDFMRPKRTGQQALDRPKVVDFNVFKTEYWGCLSGIAPSSCVPELLFAEIMGIVKGSGVSASTLMPLTRDSYITKNAKVSPAFAAEADREKVYQAFERYERLKKQRNQVDELDRVSALLKSLKESSTLATRIRQCFEEIYVDGTLSSPSAQSISWLIVIQRFKTCVVWTSFCS